MVKTIKRTVKYVYKLTFNKATLIKGWDKNPIKYTKLFKVSS